MTAEIANLDGQIQELDQQIATRIAAIRSTINQRISQTDEAVSKVRGFNLRLIKMVIILLLLLLVIFSVRYLHLKTKTRIPVLWTMVLFIVLVTIVDMILSFFWSKYYQLKYEVLKIITWALLPGLLNMLVVKTQNNTVGISAIIYYILTMIGIIAVIVKYV